MVKHRNIIQFLLGLVIVALLNVAGSFVFTRFDLTSEKRYSLSGATVDMLKGLDDIAYVRVYLEGDFPAGFKRLRNTTREMLDEFRVYAGSNIEYEFIDPFAGTTNEQKRDIFRQLVSKGLEPTSLQVQTDDGTKQSVIFPGALVSYRGKEMPLRLLKNSSGLPPEQALNNSIQNVEFELVNTIHKLSMPKSPVLAFIEGHGESGEAEVQDITAALSEFYEVRRVAIAGKLKSLDGIDLVIVAKPGSVFSDKDKFILDQFILNGGKAIWLIDAVFADMDSLANSNITAGVTLDVGLGDMLFSYGARINSNLVMDGQAAAYIPIVTGDAGGMPQLTPMPWPYFPLLLPGNNHPIVKNLNPIRLQFANSIDTVGAPGIRKTILLTTSKYARAVHTPVRISLGEIQNFDIRQYNKQNLPVAVLLEGRFTSVYRNRMPRTLRESEEIKFREEGEPTKMIVVADGDVIRNDVNARTGQAIPIDRDKNTGQEYGNKTFILNAVDYLCDATGLFTVRSKEIRLRLLDRKAAKDERAKWQVMNTALPALAVVLFGLCVGYVRRRKYVSS